MRVVLICILATLKPAYAFSQVVSAPASVETDPVPHAGDAADDACTWVHPSDAADSLIIATDKKGGLAAYGLDGKQIQYIADGNMNNVDIRYGFPIAGRQFDLAVASNRSNDTLAVYAIDPTSRVLRSIASVPTGMKSVYGMCMYRSTKTNEYFVFLNSEAGDVQQWELKGAADAKVTARLVRSFSVGGKTEGCVADDDTGSFYIAEETNGIWRYSAEPESGTEREQVDGVKPNGHLSPDVEGLTIYYGRGTAGYLIASSQGDSTYAVYAREGNNRYLGSFRITASAVIDAVTGTDGIDVQSTVLGPHFPHGVFIAQDDENDGANQNFKLVPWEIIAHAMIPPLLVESSRTPRP